MYDAVRGQLLTGLDRSVTAKQKLLAEERLAAQDLWVQLQVRQSRLHCAVPTSCGYYCYSVLLGSMCLALRSNVFGRDDRKG